MNITDKPKVVSMQDKDTGGRWFIRFPDGTVLARSMMYAEVDANGRHLLRFFDNVRGIWYEVVE